MNEFDRLVDGYRRFRQDRFSRQNALYQELAETGQSPRVMVIACCDSRADPAMIFDTAPGEIFVVRNVANLVPPYAPSDDYHGTSAALEFAVTGLGVAHILVLGHARCGGIAASLSSEGQGTFIGRWMSILEDTRRGIRDSTEGAAQQRALELAGVGKSLENLMTFPFVTEPVREKRLQLHGGYFDIATGILNLRDPNSGKFASVVDGAPAFT
ncbi:MAG: carbonic anhydrase [Alphaproteobacteria bacterium]|nr:carbonic anhydrase [Alphaproteobacteria bacterium]